MANTSNLDDNGDTLSSAQTHSITSSLGLEEVLPLSQQIKNARNRLGLSQRAFAEKVGITQAQLCRLENNSDTRPTRKTLKALSPFLMKSYSDLLVESGYNGIVTIQEEYYSYSGDAIDVKKIAEEIFQTDPSFFECLQNFSEYGTPENLSVLKILIQTMKITETKKPDSNISLFKKQFECLKQYILNILSIQTVK